jgi:hypothetical protein
VILALHEVASFFHRNYRALLACDVCAFCYPFFAISAGFIFLGLPAVFG